MSRVSTHLDAIRTALEALRNGANQPLFTKVAFQLDTFDEEDIDTKSLAAPAAIVTLAGAMGIERADGGMDMRLTVSIAVLQKAQATASADAATLDLAVETLLAVRASTFGQAQAGDPEKLGARLVQRAGVERKGLAIGVVAFEQVLLNVVPAIAAVSGVLTYAGAGGPLQGNPQELDIDAMDPGLSPEEQAIIDQWGAP